MLIAGAEVVTGRREPSVTTHTRADFINGGGLCTAPHVEEPGRPAKKSAADAHRSRADKKCTSCLERNCDHVPETCGVPRGCGPLQQVPAGRPVVKSGESRQSRSSGPARDTDSEQSRPLADPPAPLNQELAECHLCQAGSGQGGFGGLRLQLQTSDQRPLTKYAFLTSSATMS